MAKPSSSYANDPLLLGLGVAIRAIRKSSKLSQEQLALNSGLDRSYVGGLERGEHNPTVITLRRLASTLGLPLCKLLEEAELLCKGQ